MGTISPLAKYGYKQTPNVYSQLRSGIKGIAIHCMAGNMRAEDALDWFAKSSTQAGCNYNIGSDGHITCSSDEEHAPWCTSNKTTDLNCMSIEVANIKGAPNWEVSDDAYNALIELCTDICYRNGIKQLLWKDSKELATSYQYDKQNMVCHYFFANKTCPGPYLHDHFGDIAEKVNTKLNNIEWEEFLINPTVEQSQEILRLARQPLQDNDAGDWSAESRKWAVDTGLIKGSGTTINGEPNYMWQDLLTREQMAELLYRFAKMSGMVK